MNTSNKSKNAFLFALPIVVLSVMWFAPTSSVLAQTTFQYEGVTDGHVWKNLNREEKYAVLHGFYDGVFVYNRNALFGKTRIYPYHVSMDIIISSLNSIYSDPKNLDIPMYAALPIVNRYLSGEGKDNLDKDIAKVRRAQAAINKIMSDWIHHNNTAGRSKRHQKLNIHRVGPLPAPGAKQRPKSGVQYIGPLPQNK